MRRRKAIAVIITTLISTGGYYHWKRLKDENLPSARMKQDFENGDIYESDSWFLSEYEVEELQINDAVPVIRP